MAEIDLRGADHDTALYSYLVQPTTAKHNLEDVAARRLNQQPSGSPAEKADIVLRLWKPLQKEVEGQGLIELCATLERPLSPVLAAMEREGIRLDPKVLKKMSREFEKDIESLTKKIYKLCGTEFNLNSPKQLSEVLFEKLQLPVPARRGKTKTPSTAADVLEELSHQHEVPGLVLSYRELAKLKSTYIDALPELLHPETGRIHTSFNQFGTATGRLSSSDPNLQNIPIRSEYGNRIRAAFVAAPGCVLLGADYSQIELRVLAHLSQDKVLCDAFQRGEDVHARTAEEVLGIAPLAQTGEHRRIAKMINFGIVYGLTAFGLAARLGIPQGEARQYIEAYFERYAGVKEYGEEILRETRETGFTQTLFGRVRPIPEINSRNPAQRNFAERTALNSPIQGTAADLIKLAMIRIFEKLPAAKLRTRMLLQVHDELLFEVPEKELKAAHKLIQQEMEGVHTLRVPLLVDIHTGATWAELK
jgi:DNA polymerase-1